MGKRRFGAAVILLAAALMLCACLVSFEPDAPMASFTFAHSAASTGGIYVLSAQDTGNGWQAEVSLWNGAAEYRLPMSGAEADALAQLVGAHALHRWNGFHKADRRIMDGAGFRLEIDYADGQTLQASGSNAYPKGYAEAHEAICGFFGELLQKNGIDDPF